MPFHDPQGKSFNLLQFFPYVWIESKHKKEYTICICIHVAQGGGGTLGISGWGCAAGTLEPLTYTRASSAEFCYPIPPILE